MRRTLSLRDWPFRTLSALSGPLLTAGAALAGSGPASAQVVPAPSRTVPVTASAVPPALLTQHGDNARTGANRRETMLSAATVNPASFGKLFTRDVDGYLYAQPLYLPDLRIPGKGVHNVVFLATAHNSVYAFDADDPDAKLPLWKINLGPSVPADEVYTTQWTDMRVEIGITSTPVVDTATGTIFVETKTKERGTYVQRLHALSLTTGKERAGSPVLIKASVAGKGQGSVNGRIAFDPVKQLQRASLLLTGGVVYLGFGSHADQAPFHGWILGYSARTLAQTCAFNTTPDGSEGSIWQASMGLAADGAGNIFAATGNGTFSADTGGRDWGNSILRLRPVGGTLKVMDYFTPYNQAELNEHDTDLGASGPLLIPNTRLVIVGGKNGWFYLTSRDKLGHVGTTSDAQIRQTFRMSPGNIHGAPVYWDGPGGPWLYVWAEFDHLKAFHLTGGRLDPTPTSQSALAVPDGMPGGFLTVSSDGAKPGTGIVWSATPYDANANWETVPGVIRAYDAADLTHELWDSKMNAPRDDSGMFAKFCPPTVVNGKVYVSTFSGQLHVYGLLNAPAIDGVSATAGHVVVRYKKPVDPATAARPAAYALDGGARILRASLDPDGRTVYLATTPLKPMLQYTLTAAGVRDRDNPALMLPPATHAWPRLGGQTAAKR